MPKVQKVGDELNSITRQNDGSSGKKIEGLIFLMAERQTPATKSPNLSCSHHKFYLPKVMTSEGVIAKKCGINAMKFHLL